MEKRQVKIPLPLLGLNMGDPSLISDFECAEGTKNFSFKDGNVQTRRGYKAIYDPLNGVSNTSDLKLIGFVNKDGVEKYYFSYKYIQDSTTYYRIVDSSGNVILSETYSTTSQNEYIKYNFAMPSLSYKPLLFMTNGTKFRCFDYEAGNILLMDANAYTPTTEEVTAYGTNVLKDTASEINAMKYICCDDNRIWLAGGNLVRISHLQKPTYFPSTQVWKLSESCTGMARFMGEVILFTKNTTTLISGSTPNFALPNAYVYKMLPDGYGCSQHRTIVQGGNALYWANKQGIYCYKYLPSGVSIPECISEFTRQDGTTVTVKKFLKTMDWSKAFANYFDNEYRLHDGHGNVLVYDTINKTWALYDYPQIFIDGKVVNGKLYYTDDKCFQMDYEDTSEGLQDNGNYIPFVLKSKIFDFGQPANQKKFKKFYITGGSIEEAFDIDIDFILDGETLTTQSITSPMSVWGTFKFGDEIRVVNVAHNCAVPILHKGKKFNLQYQISCNNQLTYFSIRNTDTILKVKELK